MALEARFLAKWADVATNLEASVGTCVLGHVASADVSVQVR